MALPLIQKIFIICVLKSLNKTNNLLYLTGNDAILYNFKYKKYFKLLLSKDIIKLGRIVDNSLFINNFKRFLNKHNINNNIFGESIIIIVQPGYEVNDFENLKTIFLSLNFKCITFLDEVKVYNLNLNNVWINIQKNYYILSLLDNYGKIKSYYVINNYFKNEMHLYKFIKYIVQDKSIYLFGNYVDNFFNVFEKLFRNKVYLFSNNETFIIDSVIKM